MKKKNNGVPLWVECFVSGGQMRKREREAQAPPKESAITGPVGRRRAEQF